MSWNLEVERELWADICLKSFWHFCDYAMGYGNSPDHRWWTFRVHKPFCDWFEGHAKDWISHRGENIQKYLMVVVMREFGKTMIITKAGQLWLHLQDPDLSSYAGSSTVSRAQAFLDPLKVILMGDDPNARFAWLYGTWHSKNRTWTSAEIVHGARIALARSEPSMGTWGVETGLTSTHPDAGFMDDPIDYEIMGKDGRWLEKVNSHLSSLAPVFKSNALFVYTGTRYHNADAIGESLAHSKAATINGYEMPEVTVSEAGRWHVYFMPARTTSGEPIYPENWNEKRLKEWEAQSPLMYAAQLLQNPNTGTHVALTRNQIEDLWLDSKEVPSRILVSVHLDTAFKSRESAGRGDFSVIVVWGHSMDGSGDLYFLGAYGSNRWRVEQFNDQLIIVMQKLRAQKRWPFILTDEVEVGGKEGAWGLTLQDWFHHAGLPCPPVQLLRRGRSKPARILGAVPFWVNGKVHLVRGVPGTAELIEQMLFIGTSTHDDYADAAADVFHPDIYRPQRILGQRDGQPSIIQPWDRELAGMTDDSARAYYDQYVQSEEVSPDPLLF